MKPAAEDAAPQAKEPPKTSSKGAKKEAEQAPVVAPASPKPRQSETKADEAPHAPHTSAPATKDEEPTGQVEKEKVAETLPATSAFLKLVGSGEGVAPVVSEAMPEMPETLDYKARYARRLREALSLIMEVEPHVTAATVARLIGDESVETLQDVLNGKAIPTFDCLDRLAGTLFIGARRLEALDGLEGALPTFVSLAEVAGVEGASRLIADAPELKEIAFVTDDSRERRCAIIVRYAKLRCCLLTRVAVSSVRRRKTAPELPALTAARTELEEFCGRRSIALTEHEVGASDFDALVWGQIWPGWFFA